jgi:hypothetical protein
MPASLKARAEKIAERDRRSLSSWLELVVEKAVKEREAERPKRR